MRLDAEPEVVERSALSEAEMARFGGFDEGEAFGSRIVVPAKLATALRQSE